MLSIYKTFVIQIKNNILSVLLALLLMRQTVNGIVVNVIAINVNYSGNPMFRHAVQ